MIHATPRHASEKISVPYQRDHCSKYQVGTELSSLDDSELDHVRSGCIVTACTVCKEADDMVFREDEKRPELGVRPGQI